MNRSGRTIAALMVALLAIGASACGKRVSRIDPSSVTDLSGRWNDTDSRLVANELITQSMNSPWVTRYTSAHGGEAPAVIVGTFSNQTLEHIPVNTFISDLERAMINSGAVRMVASPEERSEIRAEREDQQDNARAGTRARMAYELGANYMLQGEITAIEDEEGREKVVYYQVDATLTDLESNIKVWAGQHRIKKYIERARIGW
jgi:uncharacterized protein (TIGR02722 family)